MNRRINDLLSLCPWNFGLNGRNQAREVKNLFVVDGSSCTSFPEKNPTLTIVALALRAADNIIEMKKRSEL